MPGNLPSDAGQEAESYLLARKEVQALFPGSSPEIALESLEPGSEEYKALVRRYASEVAEQSIELAKKAEEVRELKLKNDRLENENMQLSSDVKTRGLLSKYTIYFLIPLIVVAAIVGLWLKIQYSDKLSDDLIKSFFTVLITGLIALPVAVFGYYFFADKSKKGK